MSCKRKRSCSSSDNVDPIRFIKVYLPERSFQQLELPPAFVKRVNGYLPPTSILECSGKRTWSVDVEKIGNSLCFQSGWSDFVQDNSLETAHFMMFSYDGASRFSVKIYELNGCEKKHQYAVKQCKIEAQDDEVIPVVQFEQIDQNDDEMYKLVEEEQHDEYETNQLGEEIYNQPISENHDGDKEIDQNCDKMCTSVEEQHDEHEETNQRGEEMYKLTNQEHQDGDESNELTDEDYQDGEEMNESTEEEYQLEKEMNELTDEEQSASEDFVVPPESQKKSSRKKKGPRVKTKFRGVQDTNKYRLLNAIPRKSTPLYVPYKPVHPYFKLGMLPVYLTHGSLNVPMPFAQKYLKPIKIGTGIEIGLQASAKSWRVLLTTYKSGCAKFSSGWLAFVRDNYIKEGDMCYFELVDRNEFTFKVSIFPC